MTATLKRTWQHRSRIRLAMVLLACLACAGGGTDAAATGDFGRTSDGRTAAGTTTAPIADSVPGYPWHWPVDGRRVVIVAFRAPAHVYGPGHRGLDAATQSGQTVYAPAAGVIAFRGTVVDRPLITIDHGAGYVTTLEPADSELAVGDAVAAGDSVGVVTTGGHAPRGTLHVGVRIEGRYVDPRGLFGTPPRAILLPCCES